MILREFVLSTTDFFSNSTGLYLFSALLQANAAMLSIVGVFYIFKLQSYQSNIATIKTIVMTDMKTHATPSEIVKFESMSLIKKKEAAEESKYSDFTKQLLFDWINNLEKISKIKLNIKLPTSLLAFGVVIGAVGLQFASFIHSQVFEVEFCVISTAVILEIVILVFVIKGIFDAIEI